MKVLEVVATLPPSPARRARASWAQRSEPEEQLVPLSEAARRVGLIPAELRRRLSAEARVIVGGQALELRMTNVVAMRRA